MARIRHGVLGTPTGKVGDTVFRNLNKKTVASKLAESYRKSNSEAVQKNENLFARVTKFSNFLNQSDIIKNVWLFSNKPGAYSNLKIFKHNYNSIKSYGINSDCHILPPNFSYENEGIILDCDSLQIRFHIAYGSEVYKKQNEDFNPPYAFVSLIYAKDPVNPKSKNKTVSMLLSEILNGIEIIPLEKSGFNFSSEKGAFSFIDDFNTVIVFPAIVSINEARKVYTWAENGGFYVKGELPSEILYKPPPPLPKTNKESFIKYD